MKTRTRPVPFLPCCLALAIALGATCAIAQDPAPEQVSDDTLIELLHKDAYRAEFDRRMRIYTPEARRGLAEKRAKQPRDRAFPNDYSDDELIEQACDIADTVPALKARNELAKRYADADAAEALAIENKLRALYDVTPYPARTGQDWDHRAYHDHWAYYQGLNSVVKACLPEEMALKLLWDIYIEPRPYQGITRFLDTISGEPFTSPATVDVLSKIRMRLENEYTRESLDAAGEGLWLAVPLTSLLAQCGDAGFDALRRQDWHSEIGIRTMGSIDRPEARQLLLDLYGGTPVDHFARRLEILSALAIHLDPAAETPIRRLLRQELTGILQGNHDERPWIYGDVAAIAKKTGDAYFLDALRQLYSSYTIDRMQEVSATRSREAAEMSYRSAKETIAKAIYGLENLDG